MRKKIGLISNPYSGWNKKHLHKVERLVKDEPQVLHLRLDNYQSLFDIMQVFSEHEIEFLVINGGDGTIQNVFTYLLNSDTFPDLPNIVLVNGGSANMLPKDTGLKKTPVRALQDLLEWIETGHPSLRILSRNILQVDYTDRDKKTLYGMFLGTGLIYRAVQIYRTSIEKFKLRGELNPLLTTLYAAYLFLFLKSKYLKLMKTNFSFKADPQSAESNYLFFLTTLNRLVLGISPGKCRYQDKIKFVILRPGFYKFCRLFWFILKNFFSIPDRSFNDFQCFNKIEFNPCAGFILDGEIFEPASKNSPVIVSKCEQLNFLTR